MAAHVTNFGQFNLYYLCSQIVQHCCGLGALYQRRQIEYSYTVECANHFNLLSNSVLAGVISLRSHRVSP